MAIVVEWSTSKRARNIDNSNLRSDRIIDNDGLSAS